MKKKAIIGIVMLIALGGVVFGGGAQEQSNDTNQISSTNRVEDFEGNLVASFVVENNAGSSTVRLNLTSLVDGYRYTVIKKQIDGAFRYYIYSSSTSSRLNEVNRADYASLFNALDSIPSGERKLLTYLVRSTNVEFYASMNDQNIGDANTLVDWGIEDFYSNNSLSFPLISGDNSMTEVFFIKRNGESKKLTLEYPNDFFARESEILTELYGTGDYTKKALSFMLAMLDDEKPETSTDVEIRTAFKTMVSKRYGLSSLFETPVPTREQKNLFLLAFQSHFDTAKESGRQYAPSATLLDYLVLNESAFWELYDKEQIHPYVKAYMYLCYDISRPVLTSHILQSKDSYPFDYSNMVEMSVNQGKAFAESALRYLTWGVENNPVTQSGTNNVFIENPVYKGHRENIDEWISNQDQNRDFDDNYLPTEIRPEPITSSGTELDSSTTSATKLTIQNTSLSNTSFSVSGFLKSSKNFAVSHLDIWASRNIAWDAGVVSNVIVDDGNSGDFSDSMKEQLFDKNVYLDETKNRNLHVDRETDVSRQIKVGYEFAEPQRIQALLIVRGLGADSPHNGSDSYADSNNSISIQLKGASDDLLNTPSFEEIGFLSLSGTAPRIYKYRNDKNGFLLQLGNHPYTDFNNSGVSYLYYVFDEPVTDVSEITLLDNTKTDFLNISEMMVFEKDPIPYITQVDGYIQRDKFQYQNIGSDKFIGFNLLDGVGGYWTSPQGSISNDHILYLLFNGDPNNTFTLTNTVSDPKFAGLNSLVAKTTDVVQQVVVREGGEYVYSESSEIFAQQPFVTTGNIASTLGEGLLSPVDYNSLYATLGNANLLTTPFYTRNKRGIIDQKTAGNPLPFAQYGIDTPRTFAYKMYEQFYAREWYKTKSANDPFDEDRFPSGITTGGRDASGFLDPSNAYVDELDVARKHGYNFRVIPGSFNYSTGYYQYQANLPTYQIDDVSGTVKPFLPGTSSFVTSRNELDQNSLFSPDKTAGVDSLGLLSGALGMSKDSALLYLNALNQDVPSVINAYASMNETSISNPYTGDSKQIEITGQDSDNTPAYYVLPTEKSFTEMPARFTRGDLERISVFVPSLAEVRQGDLVVNFNVDGEPVIGVVVATLWDKEDAAAVATMTTSDFLENTILVGVRQGLNQVSIGRWGNPVGAFSGFTQMPEAFHVRRLLALPASETMAMKDEEGWDLFEEMDEKLRTSYPPSNRVPRGYVTVQPTVSELTSQPQTLAEGLYNGTIRRGEETLEDHYYYRELPTTSLSKRTTQSLFENAYPMKVNQLSGWRNQAVIDDETEDVLGYYLAYHLGVDLSPRTVNNEFLSAEQERKINDLRVPILAPEGGKFFIAKSLDWKGYADINFDVIHGSNATTINLTGFRHSTYGYIGVLVTRPDDVKNGRIYLFAHLGEQQDDDIADETLIGDIDYVDEYSSENVDREFKKFRVYPESWATAGEVDKSDPIAFVGNRGRSTAAHIHLMVYEYHESGWQQVDPLSCFSDSLYKLTTSDGAVVNTYGWWSRLYGEGPAYEVAISRLLNSGVTNNPANLIINTFDFLALDDTPATYTLWKTTSVNLHDEVQNEIDAANSSTGPQAVREIFLPDGWDIDRIP